MLQYVVMATAYSNIDWLPRLRNYEVPFIFKF